MRKLLDTSFKYMILGLASGVFYREFTKFKSFEGVTRLSYLHPHFLVLGMFGFLIVMLLDHAFSISSHHKFKRFYLTYNIGLLTTALMLFVRGMTEVLNSPLSKGMSAAISGIAGLSHIILTAGMMFLFSILREKI